MFILYRNVSKKNYREKWHMYIMLNRTFLQVLQLSKLNGNSKFTERIWVVKTFVHVLPIYVIRFIHMRLYAERMIHEGSMMSKSNARVTYRQSIITIFETLGHKTCFLEEISVFCDVMPCGVIDIYTYDSEEHMYQTTWHCMSADFLVEIWQLWETDIFITYFLDYSYLSKTHLWGEKMQI